MSREYFDTFDMNKRPLLAEGKQQKGSIMNCMAKRRTGDSFSNCKFNRVFYEAKAQLVKMFEDTRKNEPSKHLAKQAFMLKRAEAQRQGNQFDQNFSGLYSEGSLKTYQDKVKLFIRWCLRNDPSIKRFKQCKKFVNQYLLEKRLTTTACTVHTYAYAIARSFGTTPKMMGIPHVKRSVAEYKRNREISQSARLYYENEKYKVLRGFIVATGARRGGLQKLRKQDLRSKNNLWHIFLREKGGKSRWAPVLPEYQHIVLAVFEKSPGYTYNHEAKKKNGYLFPQNAFPANFPCHFLRATYVKLWYEKLIAQSEDSINREYRCRGARAGKSYNRDVLQQISKYIGHNRVDVVAQSYCYQM